MQQYQLTIEASAQPAALERIFRVIRHRGATVSTMQLKQDAQRLQLSLVVIMVRPINTLITQLAKLIDIKEINLIENN